MRGVPLVKSVGPLRPDKAHLRRGLVWWSQGGEGRQAGGAAGGLPSYIGSARQGYGRLGPADETTDFGDPDYGVISYAKSATAPTVPASASGSFTVLVFAELVGASSYGALLCEPWDNTASWTSPYMRLAFHRIASTDTARTWYTDSASNPRGIGASNAGFLLFDGQPYSYAVVRDRATNLVTYFRDGVSYGSQADQSTLPLHPTGNGGDDVALLARGRTKDYQETTQGRVYAAYVWDRALSQSEIEEVSRDPLALLEPAPFDVFVPAGLNIVKVVTE